MWNKGKQTNPAIVETRIEEIVDLLIAGAFRMQDLRAYAKEKGWDIGDRQLLNYLIRAKEKFQEYKQTNRAEELGKAIARYNHLYFSALSMKDYPTALRVNKALCELLGLNAPVKVAETDTEGNDKMPTSLTINVIKTQRGNGD